MGTLRIKRGTKTALQTTPGYTPLEGELVYTTDTKEVFVGDGATTGGTPVSVSTQNLEDLGNVQALAAQADQILVYNGSNWAATDNPAVDIRGNIYGDDSTLLVDAINGKIVAPVDTTTVVASGGFTGNLSGDVTGGVTGNVVGNTTGTHYGNVIGALDGDVTGSVFADDSSAIVDSIANKITTDSITTQEITVPTISSIDGIVNLEYTDVSILTMKRKQSGAHVNDDSVSRIRFATEDSDTQVIKTQGTITATDNNLLYIPSHDGVLQYANYFKVHKTGKVAINMGQTEIHNEPGATLEVNGNVKIAGANEMLLGNMTTTQRNALTAANGMMIYNTSDNKFQGYENGAWVNLI
jgi:outer membrane lipoprotein SlyB